MNQKILAGLGNIYTNEALFAARLHPAGRPRG
jgi:formamidopyrimidine-DNA glycosylase